MIKNRITINFSVDTAFNEQQLNNILLILQNNIQSIDKQFTVSQLFGDIARCKLNSDGKVIYTDRLTNEDY